MSDSDDIEILNRKIQREAKARATAESKLEDYSRDIYIANQTLKKNLEKTRQARAELEFLHITSAAVSSELGLNDLLNKMTIHIGEFIGALSATWMTFDSEDRKPPEKPYIWNEKKGWHVSNDDFLIFYNMVDFTELSASSKWLVVPIDKISLNAGEAGLLIYVRIPTSSNKSIIAAALLPDTELIEETLYVLDTAKDHLVSGIKRRISDARIKRRNELLEETVSRLETAQKQLIQSEKMASLGQLSAGVAHEINNPIGFIRSNLEVLGDYHETFNRCLKLVNEELKNEVIDKDSLLSIIKKQDIKFLLEDSSDILKTNLTGIDRVKDIVDGLRTFSHAGEDKQTEMSLLDCLNSSLQVVSNQFKYQHTIENSVAESLPIIKGNIGQLQQVFVNLFVNAADAMSDGGVLSIRSEVTDYHIFIEISDTGCGMTDDTIDSMFTPFFTTKEVGSGTGLGMSISMAILEAHHVAVTIESEVGKGTTFNLVFPIMTLEN